jgi:nicotinate-nucleotide pyrophosphorylase (carboxylating)
LYNLAQELTWYECFMDYTLDPRILEVIRRALDEDIGSGDETSNSIIPPDAPMRGQIIAKQAGVIAGLDVAQAGYALFDPRVHFEDLVEEGARVADRQVVARVQGAARSLLTVERTALNFLGRMSGIATLTRQFVEAVAGTKARILDTRKTAPGLRLVDKLAVARGGGSNHRIGLYDMILIKDNHVDLAGSVGEAFRRARAAGGSLEIEIEARSLDEVGEALAVGARRILLDNMSLEGLRQAVALVKGRARLEASGNVTLENVRAIAETGVDDISVGSLTHSAGGLDVSLELMPVGVASGV